jgi:hypothetical protein
MKISQSLRVKHRSLKAKLALAFAGVASIAVLGSAGVAAADTGPRTMYLPNKQACSSQYRAFHFKNRGACEGYWNSHRHHHNPGHGHGGNHGGNHNPGGNPGNGYGGNNGGVVVIVNGNNNVITVIINYFFGG